MNNEHATARHSETLAKASRPAQVARALREGRLDGWLAFLVGLAFVLGLEGWFRDGARDGVYFQQWTSERMMQTVAIEDLQAAPLESLWYLHVHPPLLDGVRATIAAFYPDARGRDLVRRVDEGLYLVWAVFYALIGALALVWVKTLSHRIAGFAAWLVLLLHPAMIFYASLLETTAISAFVSLWLLFEVWRLMSGSGRGVALGAAFVLAFLTRSVFQWPALVVVLAALVLARVSWRRIALVALIAGTVVIGYTVKQTLMFGLPYTSSFAGYNFCRSIGKCDPLGKAEIHAAREFLQHHPPATAASVLSRKRTLESNNYNALPALERHKRQLLAYRGTLRNKSPLQLADEYLKNAKKFLEPSSRYTKHVIVDKLPWREAYDTVFSGAWLVLLLGVSAAGWCAKQRRWKDVARGLGLALVFCYIAAVSIVFERGENQRFKFFLEPAMVVLIASQAGLFVQWLAVKAAGRWKQRRG